DLRGSVLGRLTTGSLRVTDQTPYDKYAPLVAGKKLTQERIGPRTIIYRGQGLRFRLVGGGYRMVARGSGITVSAVGRGHVMLDGEPRWSGDDNGLYARGGPAVVGRRPRSPRAGGRRRQRGPGRLCPSARRSRAIRARGSAER